MENGLWRMDIQLWKACTDNDWARCQGWLSLGASLDGVVFDHANKYTKPGSIVTPLSVAAKVGHVNIVRGLLDARASIDSEASFGTTAIGAAVFSGHLPVVKLLIERGASRHLIGSPSGDGVELQRKHVLCIALAQGHRAIAKYLLAVEYPPPIASVALKKETPRTAAQHVEIIGLVSQPQLNSLIGEICGVETDGRVPVKISGSAERPTKYVKLKPTNFVAVTLGFDGQKIDPHAPPLFLDRAVDGQELPLLLSIAKHLDLTSIGTLRTTCTAAASPDLELLPPLVAPAFGLGSFRSYVVGMLIGEVRAPADSLYFNEVAEREFRRYGFHGPALRTVDGEYIVIMKDTPGELQLGGLGSWSDLVGKRIIAVEYHTFVRGKPVLGGGLRAPRAAVVFFGGGGCVYSVKVPTDDDEARDALDLLTHSDPNVVNHIEQCRREYESKSNGSGTLTTEQLTLLNGFKELSYAPLVFYFLGDPKETGVLGPKPEVPEDWGSMDRFMTAKNAWLELLHKRVAAGEHLIPGPIYTTASEGGDPAVTYEAGLMDVGPNRTSLKEGQRAGMLAMQAQFRAMQADLPEDPNRKPVSLVIGGPGFMTLTDDGVFGGATEDDDDATDATDDDE